MANTDINVKGLKEIQAALQSLPEKLERNVVRSALRAGLVPMRDEIKRTAPVDSGALQKSVRIGTRALRSGVVLATIKVGSKKVWYAHFLEFGTAAHQIRARDGGYLSFGGHFLRSVQHPGITARPFVRPAFDQLAPGAPSKFAAKVRQVLLTKHGLDVPQPREEGDE